MSKNTYTHLEDTGVVVCDDCGASAFTEERVKHFESCDPSCSQRWEAYYHQALDDEALDKAYKEE